MLLVSLEVVLIRGREKGVLLMLLIMEFIILFVYLLVKMLVSAPFWLDN